MARARPVLALAVLVVIGGCEPEEHAGFIAFSPDGSALAHTASDTLYLHRLVGGKSAGSLVDATFLGEVAKGQVAEPRFDWAPLGASLVFTTRQFGGYDLALLTVKDLSVTRLTTHLAKDAEPRFVLGGKAIAFVSYRDGQSDLYLLTLREATVTRLTSDAVVEESLSADATGATLAFLSTNETGERWLSLVRLPDAERRLNIPLDPALIAGADPIGAVRLSPDGRRVAFTSPVGVCLIDVDRARRRLRDDPDRKVLTDRLIEGTTRASDIAFSPDSRRLAYTADGQVRVKGLAFLVGGGGISHAKATDDRSPAWHPFGRLIALAAPGGPVEIRDRHGRHVRWLVRGPAHTAGAAKLALDRGDADQAVALLEPVTAEPQRPAEAMQLLAAAYLQLGRDDEAIAALKAVSDDVAVGRVLVAQGRFDEALPAFKASTEAEAAHYVKTLPILDDAGRRALAKAVAAELRGDQTAAADAMRRFCRSKAARKTPLGAHYAYQRTEVLEELAARRSGRSRRRAFKRLAKAVREALKDYPDAETEMRGTALRRLATACRDELDDRRGAFEALTALLDLFETRSRPARPARRYRPARPARRYRPGSAGAVAAGEAGSSLSAGDAEADAAAELVRLCLDLNWPIEAGKVVRRVSRWSFANDAAALSFCRGVGEAYDAHGRHAAGSQALETLVGAYRLQAAQVAGLLADSLSAAPAGGEVKGLGLAGMSPWMRDRAQRLIRATPPGPDRDKALEVLQFVLAGTHAERAAIWDRLTAGWRDRGEATPDRTVQMVADIVLGNGCLDAGRIDAALDHFEDLARLSRRDAYRRALRQYKVLRRQHPDLVADWLDAERRSLVLYLEPALAAEFTARLKTLADKPPAFGSEAQARRAARVRERWTAIYGPFLARDTDDARGVRGLKDNVLYRASQVVDGVAAETYLRTLIAKYPESEFAAEAFAALADRCEARGTYLLACTLGQRLLADLAGHDAAGVKARVAGLYAKQLKAKDLARPFYLDVADNHIDAPQWAEAQHWMAGSESRRKRHAEAAGRLKTLVQRAPKARMVADGTAQYDLATALRLAGNAKEADAAYVLLITTYREHPAVREDRALAGVWAVLGDDAKRAIADALPGDLKRILPHLPPGEQDTLRKQFPKILGVPTTQPTTRPAAGP